MPGNVHALFQQRVDGDDTLLRLAGLRFAQMGVAAEVYADTPDALEYVLQFVPAHARLPMVHLNRNVNVLHARDRALVGEFADRFAGRVAGLVVHDKREMGAQTDRLVAGLHDLNARLCRRPDGPLVFLEYAAGLDRGWFVEVAERLQDAERVSCCIDVGHVGLRQVTATFGARHPGLDLKKLGPADYRLPELVADIQDAVGSALPHVLDVIRRSAGSASTCISTCTTGIPSTRSPRSLQFPDAGAHCLQLPRPPVTEHHVRARRSGLHRVNGHRRVPPSGGLLHGRGPPGRRPAAPRRRRMALSSLAGDHQRRANELLAVGSVLECDARG